jgi:hypothetical protein
MYNNDDGDFRYDVVQIQSHNYAQASALMERHFVSPSPLCGHCIAMTKPNIRSPQ